MTRLSAFLTIALVSSSALSRSRPTARHASHPAADRASGADRQRLGGGNRDRRCLRRPGGLCVSRVDWLRTGALKVTSTDRQGVFSFASLPDDRYTIGVSKLPYLGAIAGARRPARPGSPVVVAGGAAVTGVTIRMALGASISGTLLDERGRPASGGAVVAQQRKVQNGERILVSVPGGVVQADDRGQYRIHGLPPVSTS